MLRAAEKNLKPGGRLAVITFHSLEDRIVKRELQALATGCTCPPEFPVCVCGKKPKMKLITRKPIVSGEEAIAVTPVEGVKALQEFDEASDFCLYDEPKACSWVPLHAGELMILGPEEAHKPGCALAGPEHVRKVVVKVAVS